MRCQGERQAEVVKKTIREGKQKLTLSVASRRPLTPVDEIIAPLSLFPKKDPPYYFYIVNFTAIEQWRYMMI